MLCRTGKDARHTCGRYAVIPDRTLREKLFGTTRSTLAEAPAEVPRPLNDLGALEERPLSTCTLNDQLEKVSAF